MSEVRKRDSYKLRRLRPCNGKLEIGILLPVAVEEREFGEEAIVGISDGGDSLRGRVAIQSALLGFCDPDELFPRLEIVGICELFKGQRWSY